MPLFAVALLAAAPAQTPTQVFTLSQAAYEYGGTSIAVSGDTLASGAPVGNAVYVFGHDGAGWSEEQRVVPPAGFTGDLFGQAVDLDGDSLLVGAPGAFPLPDEVFVYRRSGTTWSLEAPLLVNGSTVGNKYGSAVALHGDTAVVGARTEGPFGAAYVFQRVGTEWSVGTPLTPTLAPKGRLFGGTVALDGDTLLVAAPDWNGYHAVHVFARSGTEWIQEAFLAPPPGTPLNFGESLALRGDEAVVGAAGYWDEAGVAFVFLRSGTSWSLSQTLIPSGSAPGDEFGASVALSPDLLALGAPAPDGSFGDTEAVYAFRRSGSAWVEDAALAGPYPTESDKIGESVAIHGQAVTAGAPYSGLGPLFGPILSIEFVPSLGGLIAYDNKRRMALHRPLPDSTILGQVNGLASLTGLTHDPATGLLWGSSHYSDELWRIDPATWSATVVGTFNETGIRAVAYTPYGLYGLDNGTDRLVTIDTSTAQCTPVGALGFDKARGLAWDAVTETLYACNQHELYTLDRGTGAGTLVGALGSPNTISMTFDPAAGKLYLLRADDTLQELAPPVMTTTTLEPIHLNNSGSVYVYDLDPMQTYCTAGVSASGCAAAISGTGTPSASAPSGFDLIAAGVEGKKRGLFFFGTNGRQAAPWGNSSSYQCVVPPVKRTTLQPETGTAGLCDGYHTLDLNAWFEARPATNPGAGNLLQTQFWYRDPHAGTNVGTSLSDGLEFALGL